MDDRQKAKEEVLDLARAALVILDSLRERRAAALIQQAIDELNDDHPEAAVE